MKPPRSQQEAEAPTVVFWDIDRCPVPPSVDPRQVGPCIERFLKHLGYSGRLIITAVGILTNVPESVLRKVSSTGVILHHADDSYESIEELLYFVSLDMNPPANIMVISTPPSYSDTLTSLRDTLLRGFNVFHPFSYDFPQEPSSINSLWRNFLKEDSWPPPEEVKCSKTDVTYPVRHLDRSTIYSLWSCLLRADSWPPIKEDKCSTTGEWVCMVCNDQGGLGAESLISHLSSREHAYEVIRSIPPHCGCKHGLDTMVETPLYYFPDTAVSTMDPSIMIKKEPENESLRRSEIETMQSEKDKAMEEALAMLESLRREMETMQMQSKNKAIAENSKEQEEAELRRLKVQCDQWRKAAEVASDMLAGGSNNNNSKYIERTGSGSREPLLNVKVSPYMYETDAESSLPKKKKGDDESSLPKKKKGSMLKKICVGY